MDPLNSRRLQYCSEGDRHCQPVPEQNLNTTSTGSASSGNLTNSTDDSNIFNRTDVTAGSKNASCASDSNGLYKSNSSNKQNNSSNNGSDLVVVFQYQVQTSRSQTVISLQSNMSALLVIEKAISDLLVGNLFGDCASDRDVRRRSRDLDVARQQRDVPYYQNQYKSRHHPSDSENIRRRTVEQFNASNVGSLTGLSAAPADRLLPGRAAGTNTSAMGELCDYFPSHLFGSANCCRPLCLCYFIHCLSIAKSIAQRSWYRKRNGAIWWTVHLHCRVGGICLGPHPCPLLLLRRQWIGVYGTAFIQTF